MHRIILVAALLCVCGTVYAQEATIWVASPWEQVLKSTPPGSGHLVSIIAARNEYEPFRIIIHAGAQKLSGVNVTVEPLKGEGGVIPASSITLYREHYVNIDKPSYGSPAPPGWYPDPLIPFVDPQTGNATTGGRFAAAPFDVEPGENQGVWADVYVPENARAGLYTARVRVTAEGVTIRTVPVRLTVRRFALPHTMAMRSNFGALGSFVAKGEGLDPGSQTFRQVEDAYIATMLAHRCIPASLGQIWPTWTPEKGLVENGEGARLDALVRDRHVNSLQMPFAYYWEDKEKCKQFLHDMAAYLRQHGCLDLGYIYMEDEPNTKEAYATVRDQAAVIHEADPGIKRLCTEQTLTQDPTWGTLFDAVDIWCPLWCLYDEKTSGERQALGEEIWSYTALVQGGNKAPFWEIDFPPVDFRAPLWISWHYNIKGFLYWSSVYWPADPWARPCYSANQQDNYWGEGMLLYPGKDAGIKGPVTSIRLKLIREAMEDFEYMALAAKSGHKAQVDALVGGLARSFSDWDRDPSAYIKAREELAKLVK